MSYTSFKSTDEYVKLNTLKNRNKSFKINNSEYPFMDTTGSYPGFKTKKSGEIYMCSCIKSALRKDIDLINKSAIGYEDSFHFDLVWYLGALLPRDVFRKLDYDTLFKFNSDNNIYADKLFEQINFKDNICRFCNVKHNKKYSKLTFEEFTDLKLFYKHQILNELNTYSGFYFLGGIRRVQYIVNEYKQIKNNDKFKIEVKETTMFLEDINKVVPLDMDYYDEKMKFDSSKNYYREFIEEKKQFEDIDLVAKERLGYGKAIGRWKREEELYSLIKKIYNKYNIIYQYRPTFLLDEITKGQQSLDIYIEELKVGIEYQGKQHYEPVEIFGGEEGFKNTVKRDQKKLEVCQQNGVKIAYIKYNEKFTLNNIKSIIEKTLNK